MTFYQSVGFWKMYNSHFIFEVIRFLSKIQNHSKKLSNHGSFSKIGRKNYYLEIKNWKEENITFYYIKFFNISLLFFSWFRVLQLHRIRVAVEVWRNITEVSVKGKNKFSIFSKSKSDFCRSFSNTIENKWFQAICWTDPI